MTTDPADRLTRAAAKLRESDDPFRHQVARLLDASAEVFTEWTDAARDDPAWTWAKPEVEALAVATVVLLGESFQQAARDLADTKQDGES